MDQLVQTKAPDLLVSVFILIKQLLFVKFLKIMEIMNIFFTLPTAFWGLKICGIESLKQVRN